MSHLESWQSKEDFERDLPLYAEYCVPSPNVDSSVFEVPDTILKYREQMSKNKKSTLHGDIDESSSFMVSGRGRGIRDRILRPGYAIETHPSDEEQLRKKIREVSGLGFSNNFIEQSIKAKTISNSGESYDEKNCINFKLVSSSSGNSVDSNNKEKNMSDFSHSSKNANGFSLLSSSSSSSVESSPKRKTNKRLPISDGRKNLINSNAFPPLK